jgi:outer membrane biosynthesis protein TonB
MRLLFKSGARSAHAFCSKAAVLFDDTRLGAEPYSPPAPSVCVSQKDEAARLVRRVEPIYPPILHGRMPTGTVVLHAEIREDGHLVALNYVSGPALLVKSATDAVAKWRYRPFLRKGHATVMYTTIAVDFAPFADVRHGSAARVQVSGSEEAKSVVHQVVPVYVAAAEEGDVTGTIVFHAIIGTDGAVKQIDYLSGPKVFLQSASGAVRMWRYKPLLVNGRAAEVETTISVVYVLNP